jgi:hypothetical protein
LKQIKMQFNPHNEAGWRGQGQDEDEKVGRNSRDDADGGPEERNAQRQKGAADGGSGTRSVPLPEPAVRNGGGGGGRRSWYLTWSLRPLARNGRKRAPIRTGPHLQTLHNGTVTGHSRRSKCRVKGNAASQEVRGN